MEHVALLAALALTAPALIAGDPSLMSPDGHREKIKDIGPVWKANILSRFNSFEHAKHGSDVASASGRKRIRRALKEITIPIHFTVVHDGKKGMLTAEDIKEQVKVLNDAFRGKTVNEAGFPSDHLGSEDAVDTKIGFILAGPPAFVNNKRLYKCGGDDSIYKEILNKHPQDPTKSIHIFSCDGGDYLGSSQFPEETRSPKSSEWGMMLSDWCFPGKGDYLGDTAVHEVGHYFGLYHTFEEDVEGKDTKKCKKGKGDGIADTPSHPNPSYGCPISSDTCPDSEGFDPTWNFMDYTDDSCMWRFSDDQTLKMHGMLEQYKPALYAHAQTLAGKVDEAQAAPTKAPTKAPDTTKPTTTEPTTIEPTTIEPATVPDDYEYWWETDDDDYEWYDDGHWQDDYYDDQYFELWEWDQDDFWSFFTDDEYDIDGDDDDFWSMIFGDDWDDDQAYYYGDDFYNFGSGSGFDDVTDDWWSEFLGTDDFELTGNWGWTGWEEFLDSGSGSGSGSSGFQIDMDWWYYDDDFWAYEYDDYDDDGDNTFNWVGDFFLPDRKKAKRETAETAPSSPSSSATHKEAGVRARAGSCKRSDGSIRCGARDFDIPCQCEKSCTFYRDCCADYQELCAAPIHVELAELKKARKEAEPTTIEPATVPEKDSAMAVSSLAAIVVAGFTAALC